MDNQSKLIVLIFAVIVALGLSIPAFVMSMNCKSNFEGFGDSLTYKQYMCANINKCPHMDPQTEWYLLGPGKIQPECPQVFPPFKPFLPPPVTPLPDNIIPGVINNKFCDKAADPNISESQYNAAMKVPPPCLNLGKTSCDKKDSCQWVPSPIVGAPGYCYNLPSYLIPQDYKNLDKGWKWWTPPS